MPDEREPISVVPSRKIRARETAVRKPGAATIRIIKGEIARMVGEAESALIAVADIAPTLVRAGRLVQPIVDELPASHGRTTEVALLRPLTAANLIYLLNKHAGRSKKWPSVDPPSAVATQLLGKGRWRFPKVAGVITTPTPRPDGTILDQPDCDPATQVWYRPDSRLMLLRLGANPTRGQAEQEAPLLMALLTGFQWQARNYSRDKRFGQSRQFFVLCEAAGMVPQIVKALDGLPVSVQSAGGTDSVTAKYDLARQCARMDTTVFHVGDLDPTGLVIFHQIALDVPAMAADLCRQGGNPIPDYACRRIAVLEEHVAEFGLLTGTVKAGDQSRRWYPGIGGDRSLTCEAEALPPDVLARLVREAVEAEVDMKALQRIVDLEEIERAQAIAAMAEVRF